MYQLYWACDLFHFVHLSWLGFIHTSIKASSISISWLHPFIHTDLASSISLVLSSLPVTARKMVNQLKRSQKRPAIYYFSFPQLFSSHNVLLFENVLLYLIFFPFTYSIVVYLHQNEVWSYKLLYAESFWAIKYMLQTTVYLFPQRH